MSNFHTTALIAALVACTLTTVAARAEPPQPRATAKSMSMSARKALTHNVGIHARSSHVPASGICNRQAVITSGTSGQLGPNGASSSQTLIAVPLNGGSAAAATQRNAVAEACAHQRR